MSLELNKTYQGNCLELLPQVPNDFVDMVLTSPPYDDLRKYKGYAFDFEGVARELYRVVKPGGVVVWVVGDATVDGSETGTSFQQALGFKGVGFNLHDTMIYKKSSQPRQTVRYEQQFEYMFVVSKGMPKTFNPLQQPCKYAGRVAKRTCRDNGSDVLRASSNVVALTRKRDNIWEYGTKHNDTGHPAVFPLELATDHILSWSNPGDTVLDPFFGSGTTGVACQQLGRNFLGFEISSEYCAIARSRTGESVKLFNPYATNTTAGE